jgi:hypothetical protein
MIINSPFLPAVKSAGGLTFAKWKGLNTARARIFSNKSKTPKQIFQRARFNFLTTITNITGRTWIKRFWKQYERNTTYMNEFYRENVPLQPSFSDESTPFEGDAELVKIMKGDLEGVSFDGDQEYDDSTGDLVVVWDSSISGNGLSTDKVFVVVADGTSGVSETDDSTTRADGTVTVSLPAGLTVDNMTVFIGTYRELTDGSLRTADGNAVDAVAAP